MEYAIWRVKLADQYIADVRLGNIIAPLVKLDLSKNEKLVRKEIYENGLKQQGVTYVYTLTEPTSNSGIYDWKVGMDDSDVNRRASNTRTSARVVWFTHIIGSKRQKFGATSHARAMEAFLHWRLRKFRLTFPAYDQERDEWVEFGTVLSELFRCSTNDIDKAIEDS